MKLKLLSAKRISTSETESLIVHTRGQVLSFTTTPIFKGKKQDPRICEFRRFG